MSEPDHSEPASHVLDSSEPANSAPGVQASRPWEPASLNTQVPVLSDGDLVGLISPSGPAQDSDIEYAVNTLESWGLRVKVGEHALDRHPNGYLAGTDDARRADLVAAWTDPEVSAVMAARGGFGAMKLIDLIDFSRLHVHRPDGRPKLLTGSSDITALHQAWAHHLGIPTLFSPMPGNAVFRNSSAIREDVRRWLFEPWSERTITGPLAGDTATAQLASDTASAQPAETLNPGTYTGTLTGGNLSLLAASVGAAEYTLPQGQIAILEDVDEEPYRLDNLLLQLSRSGWLSAAGALVFGSWQDCGDPAAVRDAVLSYLPADNPPAVWNLGIGHNPHAPAVPLGVTATLNAPTNAPPSLRIH